MRDYNLHLHIIDDILYILTYIFLYHLEYSDDGSHRYNHSFPVNMYFILLQVFYVEFRPDR